MTRGSERECVCAWKIKIKREWEKGSIWMWGVVSLSGLFTASVGNCGCGKEQQTERLIKYVR